MAWTDSLRASSFRGVPFEVDTAQMTGGRRVGVHETPGGDNAVTEDLGRRTRAINVEAYVIGDDAVAQSIALIAAIEAPGPGTLVHPIYGEITVNIPEYRQVDSWDNGNVILLSLSCIEAGELSFITLDSGSALDTALDAMDAATLAELEDQMVTEGFSLAVLDAAIAAVEDVMTAIEEIVATPFAAVAEVSSVLTEAQLLKSRATALANAPADFGAAVQSLMRQLGDLFGLRRLAAGAGNAYVAPTPSTPSRDQAAQVAYAAERAQIRYALGAACAHIRDTDLTEYDAAIADRDAVAALIAAEEEVSDGDVVDALRSLRTALIEDVTARVARLPRTTLFTPPGVVPTVLIAQALYGDADRETEIIARNDIIHPMFAPVEPLSVLTT
jgi:prophage DNA circulation protein